MAANLSWVTDDLAVGGRFAEEHVEPLARDAGVGAVVDLRAEDCDDASLLAQHHIAFLHLPTHDNTPVAATDVLRGLAFVETHLGLGRRVLVHCEHGIGRSAQLALCVLVARGMSPLDALALAKARRRVVSPCPAQLDAWAAWLRARGHEVPDFGELAAIAYRVR